MRLKNISALLIKTGLGLAVAAGVSLLIMQYLSRDYFSEQLEPSILPTSQVRQKVIQNFVLLPDGTIFPSDLVPGGTAFINSIPSFLLDSNPARTSRVEPEVNSAPSPTNIADGPMENGVQIAALPAVVPTVRVNKPTVSHVKNIRKPKNAVLQWKPTAKQQQKMVPTPEPSAEYLPQKEDPPSMLDEPLYENKSLEDGDIILDVLLRKELVYRGLFCQLRSKKIFLPMGEIFGIVGFPIEISKEGAEGWFIKENRGFSFSLESGKAISNGIGFALPMESFFYFEEDIYMEMDQLNKFFPLTFTEDYQNLLLLITPHEYLPMELMKTRRNKQIIKDAKNGLRYPLRDLDYAAIAPPRLDTKFNFNHIGNNGNEQSTASVGGLYRGDLLFMSTSLYGSIGYNHGDKDSDFQFSDFSLTGERVFTDNPYLARIELGDIVPSSTPLGPSGSLERGIRVSNISPMSSTTENTKTFTGKGIPGWDVELYRDNQLVGFKTILPDGTYTFENVALNFGVNKFKLKLYGTEGQEETRQEIVTVGSSMVAGEVKYDASVSQQGVGVFNGDISKVTSVEDDLKGTTRIKTSVDFGIGEGMAIRTGLTKDKFRDTDRTIGSVGISGGVDIFLGQVDLGYSTYGSTLLTGSLRGRLDGGQNVGVNAQYQLSDNYEESAVKNQVQFNYSDGTKLNKSTRVSYSGRVSRTANEASTYYNVSGSMGIFSDFGYITSNLGAKIYEDNSAENDPDVYGSSTFYKSFSKGSVRANADYSLDEGNSPIVKSISVSGNLRINPKLNTVVSASKYLTNSELLTLSNSWSYSFGDLKPFLKGTWRDDDSYSVGVGFSLGFDFDPNTFSPEFSSGAASYGGASCLVYNDKNYNNKFDGGDEPLEDIPISAHQQNQDSITDENGRALFYRMHNFESTDIAVDEGMMEDISLSSAGGVAVTPRKGRIYDLQFPMHVCGTIEGYAYRIVDDQVKGRPQIPIELLANNGTVSAHAWTETDGFFVMDRIYPGTYSLRIGPEYLKNKSHSGVNYAGTTVRDVVINKQGNTVSDAFLFFGKEPVVKVLEEKFQTKLKLGDDAQQFFDYSNLDVPMENQMETAVTKISGILAELDISEVQDMDNEPNLSSVAKNYVPQKDSTAVNKETISDEKYALVIDVFTSTKSAERAIKHYKKKYGGTLTGYDLLFKQKGAGCYVYLTGIYNKTELLNMANLFMCKPTGIKVTDLLN